MLTITIPEVPISTEPYTAELAIAVETEAQALKALHEKFSSLAVYGKPILLSQTQARTVDWKRDTRTLLKREGKPVVAIVAWDGYTYTREDNYGGRNTGSRLYLTCDGWIETTRTGTWSSFQGEPDQWEAASRDLSNVEVAAAYDLRELLAHLATSVAELDIPARLTCARQRTANAHAVLDVLAALTTKKPTSTLQ